MRGSVVLSCLLGAACAPPPATAPAPAPPPRPTAAASAAPLPAPPYLTSSRIAALADGVLVVDADSGLLVATDADGGVRAQVAIGRDAGMLAFDRAHSLAYVADRRKDRIVVVRVGGGGNGLEVVRAWPTPAEPFGVALAPDAATVLVTLIADRALVAYAADTGAERWRLALAEEPRTIAVSPDGARALVTSAASGAIYDVALAGERRATALPYDLLCDHCANGDAYARGGAALFLDPQRAIASFQREVPVAIEAFQHTRYGGSSSPITQHLSFWSFAPAGDATPTPATPPTQVVAQIAANQPRTLLWDGTHDTLFVAGFASDTLLRLRGLTTGTTDEVDERAADFVLRPSERCGPDGLARSDAGDIYVWCAFSRRIVRFYPEPQTASGERRTLHESAPIASSAMTPEVHRGFELFHAIDPAINHARTITCATCHIDGRADGLSWKIRDLTLQTPALGGRVAGTAPYKWDASDATIERSLASTVTRLGGRGLGPADTAALVAYLHALPPPRKPTLDAAAVARGKAVFAAANCDDCHRGRRFTDGALHDFGGTLPAADTPSLLGLAATAPYYHDGSAPTLAALLAGEGSVHMTDLTKLSPAQRTDLAAFLASL